MEIIDSVYDRCDEAMEKVFTDFMELSPKDPNYGVSVNAVLNMTKNILDSEKANDAAVSSENELNFKYKQLEVEESKNANDAKIQSERISLDKEKLENDSENAKYQRAIDDEKNRIEVERIKTEDASKKNEVICDIIRNGVSILSVVISNVINVKNLGTVLNFETEGRITKSAGWKFFDYSNKPRTR